MKILAIHHHYDCDTSAHARILRAIIEQQVTGAHDITVLTAQPAQDAAVRQASLPGRETIRGVHVRRVGLLREKSGRSVRHTVNIGWFLLRALIHAVVADRYDLIIATNRPSVLMGFLLRAIRALRGVPYIYHCQDLYPELAAANGDLGGGRLYNRMVRWDTATCLAARRTIVPSREMAQTLAARGVPADRLSVIRSTPFVINPDGRPSLPPPPSQRPDADAVRFLFAGELDRHQGLERLIAAARLVAGRVPFQFVFMGDGPAKGELIELAGDLLGRRIKFMPPQSIEATLDAIRLCDYGIVSLAVGAHYYTYPAECTLYGSSGCPMIALIEPQCELAQMIERHEMGFVAASRSVAGIAETIVKAVIEHARWTPQRRLQLQMSSRAVFRQAEIQTAWDDAVLGHLGEPIVPRQNGTHSKAA